MFRVTLLGDLVAKVAHSAYHQSEDVGVVLVFVVLAELGQFQQEEEGD